MMWIDTDYIKTERLMFEDDCYTDFPEYGRHCFLITPWKGYRSTTIVAKTVRGYVVQVSSGAELDVYPDEIEFD